MTAPTVFFILSKIKPYVQNFSTNKQSTLAEFQQTTNGPGQSQKNGKWQSLAIAIM
jgi:hypothetical protein